MTGGQNKYPLHLNRSEATGPPIPAIGAGQVLAAAQAAFCLDFCGVNKNSAAYVLLIPSHRSFRRYPRQRLKKGLRGADGSLLRVWTFAAKLPKLLGWDCVTGDGSQNVSARIAELRATTTACPSIDYIAFGASVPACFERAAGLYPNRIAVHCRLGEISYADLNAAANRLARRIIESGGRVGDRVAILMPQDRRIFIAMLAALKAGRIVVVLNGQDPPARIAQLVDDADPTILLTIDRCLEQAMEFAGARLGVIDVDAALGCGPAEGPAIELGSDDTALLVYTSGSTGRPKGVMKTHGMIIRDAVDVGRAARVATEDRVLLVASLWGGQAQCTTWITLFSGASLMSFPAVENGVTGTA